MGLYKYAPEPSARMGLLWTLGTIKEAVLLEFGSMGHMIYANKWMKQTGLSEKSHFYTTHIDEKDIALGITKRLEHAVAEIMEKHYPKVIFVLPSSVPETIGTDLEAICEEVEQSYDNVRLIALKKGGFQEQLSSGVEEALYEVARYLTRPCKKSANLTCNLIGSCADVTKFSSDAKEVKRMLQGAFDIDVSCVLTADVSIKELESMGGAHINIVLRKEGIKAAEQLKKEYGTPFLYGAPYGYEGTKEWLIQVANLLEISLDEDFVTAEFEEGREAYLYAKQLITMMPRKAKISIGGNFDVVKGIHAFACEELGMKQLHIWCDNKSYSTKEIPYRTEAELLDMFVPKVEGIIMANQMVSHITNRQNILSISRGLQSFQFNPYECPYMGFRGAMNLCAQWLEYLLT